MDVDPQARLLRLQLSRASDRKKRLFICALARRVWALLDDGERRGAEVAERLADGLCGEDERLAAFEAAGGEWSALYTQANCIPAKALMAENLDYYCADAAASVTQIADEGGQFIREATPEQVAAEAAAQSALLRDLFGDPLRATDINPAWLAWNDRAAGAIAQGTYEGRAFDQMPILADALEDAGCTDRAVLDHCRGPNVHVRGCWVLDALLGRG